MKSHARNIMNENVTAVAPDTPLATVVAMLVAAGIGGVPVVDLRQRVVGFVSEIDLMDALLRNTPPETLAQEIMSKAPIVIDEFTPSEEVMELLGKHQLHHLPVVREGRLVGIISPIDVLRSFVERVLTPPPEVG